MSFFIDVQGTLLSDKDKSLIEGSKEFIDFLNEKNLPYVVITNNTKKISDEFLNSLRNQGLNIKDGAYLDPFCVLKEILPICDVALFGADEFKKTMQDLGYNSNYKNPKAVLVASYDKFSFDEFALMNELVLDGAKFIPLHATSIYKKNSKLYPGVGSIAKMICNATNCEFEVVGKPSLKFYNEALRLIKMQNSALEFENIEIISDDASGDLLGAKKLGMKTSLVLSGKISDASKLGDLRKCVDKIYKNMSEILGEKLARN